MKTNRNFLKGTLLKQFNPVASFLLLAFFLAGCNEHNFETENKESLNPSSQDNSSQEIPRPPVEVKVENKPLTATLSLPKKGFRLEEQLELSLKLEIAPLWEIRAMDAQPENVATRLELELPGGVQTVGNWTVPETTISLSPDSHPVFSGESIFRQKIQITDQTSRGEYQIKCLVHYQACDEKRCLKPTQIELTIPVIIE